MMNKSTRKTKEYINDAEKTTNSLTKIVKTSSQKIIA